MTPEESAALAMMDDEGCGYKKAAKAFNCDPKRLRELRRRAPAPAPAREAPSSSGWRWSTLGSGASARPEMVAELRGTASQALSGLQPGGRVCGLTAGQFSLLDLIRACLEKTGPARVTLSTWTAGIRDAETAAWLISSGNIQSFRILTDRSFPTRQPAYCRRLVELFGNDSIVITNTHAKFAVIQNEEWNIAIRSSMNLNKNRRWEQFDCDDDIEIARMFVDFAEDVAEATGPGLVGVDNATVEDGFEEVMRLARWRKEAPATPRPLTPQSAPEEPGDDPTSVEWYAAELRELERAARDANPREQAALSKAKREAYAAWQTALAQEESRSVAEEPAPPPLEQDAALSDPVSFWAARVRHCAKLSADTGDQRGKREWEIQLRAARKELDAAKITAATEEAHRYALEVRDPIELATKLIELAPTIAKLVPDQARELWRELGKTLGETC